MRTLASVQRIREITPIQNADRIELAHILGWQCVVKKGEFKPNDLCVYYEIDSFLPVRAEYEFLRNSSYRKSELLGEGFRLRTQTFRGEISQGLALPLLSVLEYDDMCKEGDDLTEVLGVRKWEIPEKATSGGTVIGELPGSIPATDETRIQAMPELLQEFAGLPYYISTKMDGSSHSIGYDAAGLHVTGHTYEYQDDGKCGFYEYCKKHGLPEKLEAYHKEYPNVHTLTLQGEYCGPGMQKNRLRLNRPVWYLFDVRINEHRAPLEFLLEIAERFGIETVPVEETGLDLPSKYPTVEALLARADGDYPNGGKKEGIVIRPTTPQHCQALGTDLSMKVINNAYLLKHD